MIVTCPVSERWPDDIVGCGETFDAEPDFEGLIDCPHCGIWFTASPEAASLATRIISVIVQLVTLDGYCFDGRQIRPR